MSEHDRLWQRFMLGRWEEREAAGLFPNVCVMGRDDYLMFWKVVLLRFGGAWRPYAVPDGGYEVDGVRVICCHRERTGMWFGRWEGKGGVS